jgi:dUTP pyrophosphatase
MNIQIKRLTDTAKMPTYATDGSAGADLYANEDVLIGPGCRVMVKTGIAVALPDNVKMDVRPRSGLAIKHGVMVVNSPGLVDPDYRGEVCVLLINIDRFKEFKVARGDRVAQVTFTSFIKANFDEVDDLSETSRGSGGFGSTGTN